MFHFGFSYVGLVFLCMLLIPNFIWTKKKPLGYEEASPKENKFLLALERIGEVLVSVLLLIFKDFNIDLNRLSALPLLVLAFVLMICYEFYRIRYFKSKRSLKDFYSSLFGIPVAGASYPVLAVFVLGLYGSNSFLLLSSAILGIGHIGIHLGHRDSLFGKKRRRLPFRILKSLAVAFAGFIIIILIGYFGIKNAKFIKAFAFAKNPVFEDAYVNLNGQNQFIRVMGRNKENPVVILLHGGPSGPDGMMDYAFMDYLLDEYTYITWDQRGCGRTYYKNHASDPENKTANVDQLLDDIDELVDYACNRFKQDKVTIIGHSWGTVLATKYSHVHPEKIQKTICIGQVISFFEGDELAYYNALEKAERAGDETSSMKEAFKAYQETEDLFTLTKLRSFTQAYNKPDVPEMSFLYGALSPYLGIDDMRWMFFDNASPEKIYRNNKILVDYVFDKELTEGIDVYGMNFNSPIYFISGEMDWTCPVILARQYYEKINAPKKDFFEVKGCGHTPQGDKPLEVAKIIKDIGL